MTRQQLARMIEPLSPRSTLTMRLEKAIGRRRSAGCPDQRAHWLGWLDRDEGRPRDQDAKFVYNHIQSAPMLLWLCEAVCLPPDQLKRALAAVLAEGPNGARQCAAFRRILPWAGTEEALVTGEGRRQGIDTGRRG